MSPQAVDEAATDAADVVNLLMALTKQPSVQRFTALAQENERLKQQLQDLDAANRGTTFNLSRTCDELKSKDGEFKAREAKLQNELKNKEAALEKVTKEKQKLAESLATSKKTATDIEEQVERLQTDLEKQEEEFQKQLREKEGRLQKIDSFSVPLKSTDEAISRALRAIYSSARKVADTHFAVDIPSVALTSDQRSELNNFGIPLLSSNTALAKQMRVALFLRVLGNELREHMFQPTYLLKDAKDLNRIISTLAKKNPEQESFFRSLLLSVAERTRNGNDSVEKACIEDVVNGVDSRLSPLLPETRRHGFKSDLQSACATACWVESSAFRSPVCPGNNSQVMPEWCHGRPECI
ncbi:hypothetical protein MFIFM68171_02992 [Madurella fahalii]|uniref:Uncharacterized protein n=1 Tax=Madurella fahalii TaxID=1157608 RepID=A0ABQ0G4W3_9PEZI